MDNFRNKATIFLNKYLILFIILFTLLTLLPYTFFCRELQVTYTSGLIYRGILSVIIGLFFVFIILIYKSKLPIYVYIFTGIYLISQIITIFVTPAIKNVNVPLLTTFIGLGQAIITGISVVCYLSIYKDTEFNKKTLNIACLFMIFFGLALCLYTYIFEYQDIYNTFNTIYGWNYDVTSIFIIKTEYGFVLYICTIFSLIYILNNKKYWMYIIPIFFLINMCISRNKTSILCTSIVLFALLIIHIAKSWNKYKRRWIIAFSVIGTLLITFIVLTSTKIGYFSKINYYITQVIFNDARVVLEDRIHKWSLLLQAINNPFNIIFGCGERVASYVLSECGCATIGDNIYLTYYGVGGVIKLGLYLALIVYLVTSISKSTTSRSKKIVSLVIPISFLIGGLFEDDSIIGVSYNSIISIITFYSIDKLIKVS